MSDKYVELIKKLEETKFADFIKTYKNDYENFEETNIGTILFECTHCCYARSSINIELIQWLIDNGYITLNAEILKLDTPLIFCGNQYFETLNQLNQINQLNIHCLLCISKLSYDVKDETFTWIQNMINTKITKNDIVVITISYINSTKINTWIVSNIENCICNNNGSSYEY